MDSLDAMQEEFQPLVLKLPNETLNKIFSHLTRTDLRQTRLTCKRFRELSNAIFLKSTLHINSRNLTLFKEYLENEYIVDCPAFESLEMCDISKCDMKYVLRRIGWMVRKLMIPVCAFIELYHLVPNLRELSFGDLSVTPKRDKMILPNLSNWKNLECLKFLDFSKSIQIERSFLQHLANTSTTVRIKHIALVVTDHIELDMMDALENNFKWLTEIDLQFNRLPQNDYIRWGKIFQNFTKLQSVKISGVLSEAWLRTIFTYLPKEAPLKTIDFCCNDSVSKHVLRLVSCKWRSTLKHLDFMFCPYINNGIRILRLLHDLQVLNLRYCRGITSDDFLYGILLGAKNLKELYIDDGPQLDTKCICMIAKVLRNLQVLSLGTLRKAVNDISLAFIFKYQTRLKKLVLDDCKDITDEGLIGYDHSSYSISCLEELEELSLRGCTKITNRSFIFALHLKNLRTLKFGYSDCISLIGIRHLAQQCPLIEYMSISSCNLIDNEAVNHIVNNFKLLHKLEINNCRDVTQSNWINPRMSSLVHLYEYETS